MERCTKPLDNRDSKTNFSNGKSCKLIPKQASKMYEADIDNPAAQTWLTDDPETARNPSANASSDCPKEQAQTAHEEAPQAMAASDKG